MVESAADQTRERLILRSRLSEIARVPPWIGDLASRYPIPEKVRFAIELCLEEALSNVIRHGYAGAEDRSVMVSFTMPRDGYFEFAVEDDAPPFNPLTAPELPALNPHQEIAGGGQGIRLMRQFADVLDYEPTPTGNRLRVGFSSAGSAVPS